MNLKTLKKERDKLVAHIEKCRQDLAAVERVMRLFGEKEQGAAEGISGASPEGSAAVPLDTSATTAAAPTPSPREEVGGAEEASKGWLKELVAKALEEMTGDFTKSAVFDKMVSLNPENKGRIRPEAVSAVVWRMANRTQELETVVQGKGSKPSLYRKRS